MFEKGEASRTGSRSSERSGNRKRSAGGSELSARPVTDPGVVRSKGRVRLRRGGNRRIRPASCEVPIVSIPENDRAGSKSASQSRRNPTGRRTRLFSWISGLFSRSEERGKTRKPRVGLALRALVGVFTAVVLMYGGYRLYRFVMSSPHFHVSKVVFSPTVKVTSQDLMKLTGISKSDNIFEVDLTAVALRVKRHPWIATAVASRRLPSQIHIKVTEQKAAASVLMEKIYLVNSKGEAFKRATVEELSNLPIITGIGRDDYRRHPGSCRARIKKALHVMGLYEKKSHRPPIGEIHLAEDDSVTLYTKKKAVQIRLGKDSFNEKLLRLDAVLTSLGKASADLRTVRLDNRIRPERVTVKLLSSGASM